MTANGGAQREENRSETERASLDFPSNSVHRQSKCCEAVLTDGGFWSKNLLIRITAERVCFYWRTPQFPHCHAPTTPSWCWQDMWRWQQLVVCCLVVFSSSISTWCLFLLIGLKETLCTCHFLIFCKLTKHLCSHSHTQVTLTSVCMTFWHDLLSPSLCFDWKTALASLQSRLCKEKKSVFASLTSFYFPGWLWQPCGFIMKMVLAAEIQMAVGGEKAQELVTLRDSHEKIAVFFPHGIFFC